jgi:hypothetical protein
VSRRGDGGSCRRGLVAAGCLALLCACAPVSGAVLPPRSATKRPAATPLQCVSAVTALLSNELLQVASGRPDEGKTTVALIVAQYPPGTSARERIDTALDTLLKTASADLLAHYQMNVVAELKAYQPRIMAACAF